jgi:beta-lactamase class D
MTKMQVLDIRHRRGGLLCHGAADPRAGGAGMLLVLATTLTHLALAATPPAATEPWRRECVVIAELGGESAPYVSDAAECAVASSPASTFKLPHALIALETGVVADPLAPVPWDGKERAFPAWNRDHSLDSAVKNSVVWFFQRTAGLIGREKMLAWLEKLDYAADSFEGELTMFWLNGDLAVTPLEEVRFLRRMLRYELPALRRHVDVVKTAFLMPEGKITNAAGSHDFVLAAPQPPVVRAKTGNTQLKGENVSWLVGEIEANGKAYVFASRVRSSETLPTTAGAELARQALNARSEEKQP